MPNTKKKFPFKIGADPEFVLTMQNQKADAQKTMELMLMGKKEFTHNPNKRGFDVGKYGNIGWDGASSTGEVRPSPSADPQEITNNLATIFKEFIKYVKICDMSVLSEFSSIGGHIHLEWPKGERTTNEKINKIHRQLAAFYMPIMISENKTNLNIRIKSGYGALKDFRVENHFTHDDGTPGYTFEFRCPSAEWLSTPKIAYSTLCYFGVVYNEIIKHPKNFAKFNDLIYKSEKQGEALQTLALMEFQILTEQLLKKTKKYIKTFEFYNDYKEEIEYIFNTKQVIKDKIKANYNIAEGWNLIKHAIPTKSQILSSKKKIEKIAEEKDFDLLKGATNIHFNDDTNVAMFADTLKDRVVAYNWKLKNNYYLFGIRKGINNIIARNLKNDYLTGREEIKTILDDNEINKLFDKMNSKFDNNIGIGSTTTLDFITGKPKDMRESIILIGIPYAMRTKSQVKEFLDVVWSIEKRELPKKIRKEAKLINDTNLPPAQRGEIYKILTKQNTSQTDGVVLDRGSTSLRRQNEVVDQILDEAMRELN